MLGNYFMLFFIGLVLLITHVLRKWSIAVFIMLPLVFLTHDDLIQGLCLFAFILFMCLDGKHKGKDSIFVKYNVFCKDNQLSKRANLLILAIGSFISLLVIVMLILKAST